MALTKHESVVVAEANSSHAQQSQRDQGATVSLEYCLQEHTREEVLDCANSWYCSHCKKHQQAKKMVKFWSSHLPQVLVLVLKRFEFRDMSNLLRREGMTYREKIGTLVDFPVEGLDLRPFCGDPDSQLASCLPLDGDCREGRSGAEALLAAYCGESQPAITKIVDDLASCSVNASNSTVGTAPQHSTKYDLFAVCNHYGRMGFGHYTAMARDWLNSGTSSEHSDGDQGNNSGTSLSAEWFNFDDDDVEVIDPGHVNKTVVSSGAYILFYKRRDLSPSLL